MAIGKINVGIKISTAVIAFCLLVIGFAAFDLPPVSFLDESKVIAGMGAIGIIALVALLASIEHSDNEAMRR